MRVSLLQIHVNYLSEKIIKHSSLFANDFRRFEPEIEIKKKFLLRAD